MNNNKELIKLIGIKNFIIIVILDSIQGLLNLPYKIIRIIVKIIFIVSKFLYEKLFFKKNIVNFLKIKKIEDYTNNLKNQILNYKKLKRISVEKYKVL